MENSYDKMTSIFREHQGKVIENEKYEAVVCGFHYKWDDSDSESLIVAITKNKNSWKNGINYRVNGDVIVNKGYMGYEFIHISDIEKILTPTTTP